jgi:hypothetical protein
MNVCMYTFSFASADVAALLPGCSINATIAFTLGSASTRLHVTGCLYVSFKLDTITCASNCCMHMKAMVVVTTASSDCGLL